MTIPVRAATSLPLYEHLAEELKLDAGLFCGNSQSCIHKLTLLVYRYTRFPPGCKDDHLSSTRTNFAPTRRLIGTLRVPCVAKIHEAFVVNEPHDFPR